MNFKAWLNTLLNEFNITNLYDFYALELGKNQVQSYGDSLQDKEINAKIIQTGNDLLEDINDSLEIILLDRFIPPILDLYRVYGFRLGSFEDYLNHEAPEYVDKIMKYFPLYRNKEFRMRFYDDIISDKSWIKKLYNYTKQERHEALVTAHDFLISRELISRERITAGLETWDQIYKLYLNNWTDEILTSPKEIIKRIDSVLQMIHNSGSILQYMPPELDKGLQYRDNVTHLNQLLRYASNDVRELLRSAALSGKTTSDTVNYGQMFLTAARRSEKSSNLLWQINQKYIPKNITLKSFNNNIATYEVDTTLPNNKKLTFDIRCIFYNFDKKHKAIKAQVLKNTIQFDNLEEYIDNYKKSKLHSITKTDIPGLSFEQQGEYRQHTDYNELAAPFMAWLSHFIAFFGK